MTDPIQEAAQKWANAVKSCCPENVLELYHPDGVLWGTLSPTVRHGQNPILEYFISFFKREGLSCTFIDGVSRYHGDFAFYSGTYEFTWKAGTKTILLPARFSFVYKNEGGKWLIMEHHSSMFPELPFKMKKYIKS
jgi:uncharacterized protein (TIGR02246 family)